jgi:hypothetical protein
MTIRSIPAHNDQELWLLLDGDNLSLRELAPYNGTVPGARAIAECRAHRDKVQAEIDRRGLTR